MPFISIAIFIVAVSFLLTCIYLSKTILQISFLFKTISETVDQVELQLDDTIHETEQLILSVERTATDVESKLLATDGVFKSLENVGEATSYLTSSVKGQAQLFNSDQTLKGTLPFIRTIQMGQYVSTLFKSWQRGKRASMQNKF